MGFEALGTGHKPVVSAEEPTAEPGRIWFDTSPDDGTNWYVADDTGWTLVAGTSASGTDVDVSGTDVAVGQVRGAHFDVAINSVTDSPNPGDTVSVTVYIENTGHMSDNQTISLAADDSQRDSTDVSLDGESSTTESLEWDTSEEKDGEATLIVESGDDRDTQKVSIFDPPSVTIDYVTDPDRKGEVDVSFRIDNVSSSTVGVDLVVKEKGTETRRKSISRGYTRNISQPYNRYRDHTMHKVIQWSASSLEAGTYTVEVKYLDKDDSSDLTIVDDSSGIDEDHGGSRDDSGGIDEDHGGSRDDSGGIDEDRLR